jgi:hypothetical protein
MAYASGCGMCAYGKGPSCQRELCATTFPKRRFLGKVAYVVHYGAVVPLTVGFGTIAAAHPIWH